MCVCVCRNVKNSATLRNERHTNRSGGIKDFGVEYFTGTHTPSHTQTQTHTCKLSNAPASVDKPAHTHKHFWLDQFFHLWQFAQRQNSLLFSHRTSSNTFSRRCFLLSLCIYLNRKSFYRIAWHESYTHSGDSGDRTEFIKDCTDWLTDWWWWWKTSAQNLIASEFQLERNNNKCLRLSLTLSANWIYRLNV